MVRLASAWAKALTLMLLAASCSTTTSGAPPSTSLTVETTTSNAAATSPSTVATTSTSTTASAAVATVEPQAVLDTPCFSLGADFNLPVDYIAADVSPNDGQCWFVLQAENRADTTVIAGELWISSQGATFQEFADFVAAGLSQGQEPDLLPLQLLNTGASGNPLEVIERTEIDAPNEAVVLLHPSNRREGFQAMSAVVHFDVATDGSTAAMFMWGLVTEDNITLFPDVIRQMEIKPDFVPG